MPPARRARRARGPTPAGLGAHARLPRHFSTKPRRYSTTLGALRAARAEHNQAEHEITTGRLPYFEEDQVLKVARWRYLGQGLTPGEAFLTAAITGQPLSLDSRSAA